MAKTGYAGTGLVKPGYLISNQFNDFTPSPRCEGCVDAEFGVEPMKVRDGFRQCIYCYSVIGARQLTTGVSRRLRMSKSEPGHKGNGTSFRYQRVIFGALYSFTFVVMPDGETRYFVTRYNGYVGGPQFACAWSPVKSVTTPAKQTAL